MLYVISRDPGGTGTCNCNGFRPYGHVDFVSGGLSTCTNTMIIKISQNLIIVVVPTMPIV